MRTKFASITQWIAPTTLCVLCNQYHHAYQAICSSCQQLLPKLEANCSYCAQSLPDTSYLICGNCCKKRPHFDQAKASYRFENPLRQLLHQFKYQGGLYLTSLISQFMLESTPPSIPETECLIPVPMHPQRLKERGFNHAALLTQRLAKTLNRPYELNLCQKVIHTQPQAGLDREERMKNLKKAFEVRQNTYQHVTIIDDLLTTGSTGNALAEALKNQGVKTVVLWCCARA